LLYPSVSVYPSRAALDILDGDYLVHYVHLALFKTSSKRWRIKALFFSVVMRILLEGGVMVCSHLDILTVSGHPPEVLQ
jgi:hypothetical protein